MEEPAGRGAVVEVEPVNLREEAVDRLVRPEAVHPQGHLVGAVCKSLVCPAGGDDTQSNAAYLCDSGKGKKTHTLNVINPPFHGELKVTISVLS